MNSIVEGEFPDLDGLPSTPLHFNQGVFALLSYYGLHSLSVRGVLIKRLFELERDDEALERCAACDGVLVTGDGRAGLASWTTGLTVLACNLPQEKVNAESFHVVIKLIAASQLVFLDDKVCDHHFEL